MDPRQLKLFKALNTVRYGRANLLAVYLGGSIQNRKRELGYLKKDGYLSKPRQQRDAGNFRYSPRVYELTDKARAALEVEGVEVIHWSEIKDFKAPEFWHRLMIADIVLCFMIAAQKHGLRFRNRKELIGDAALSFPCHIDFPTKDDCTVPYDGALEPDDLIAIEDLPIAIEADRKKETIRTPNPEVASYKRKLLQYRYVSINKSFQKYGLKRLLTVHITPSVEHCDTIQEFMGESLKLKSQGQLFAAFPELDDRRTYPGPIDLLEYPFKRVGFDSLIIGKEIFDGPARNA